MQLKEAAENVFVLKIHKQKKAKQHRCFIELAPSKHGSFNLSFKHAEKLIPHLDLYPFQA